MGIDQALQEGRDSRQLIKDLLAHYRGLLITQFVDRPENLLNMSIENVDRIKEQGRSLDTQEISRGIIEFSKTNLDARYSTQPRILLEVACIKLTRPENQEAKGVGEKQFSSQEYKRVPKPTSPDNKEAQQNSNMFAEPAKAETAKTEAAKTEPAKAETAKTETAKTEPAKTETAKSEAAKKVDSDKNPNGMDGYLANMSQEELWDKAMSCMEKEKATFRVARGATCICQVDEECVVIQADTDFLLCRLEDNKELIESTLEELTGVRKAIVARLASKGIPNEQQKSAEATKKEVEASFKDIAIEIDYKGE